MFWDSLLDHLAQNGVSSGGDFLYVNSDPSFAVKRVMFEPKFHLDFLLSTFLRIYLGLF